SVSLFVDTAFVAVRPGPLRDARSFLEQAEREFERGDVAEAVDLLERSVALDGVHARARTLLAVACARLRRLDEALEQLGVAIRLDPDRFAPRCVLGELYLWLGIPAQARPHLRRARQLASTAAERGYVDALLKQRRAREARRTARQDFRAPLWLFR